MPLVIKHAVNNKLTTFHLLFKKKHVSLCVVLIFGIKTLFSNFAFQIVIAGMDSLYC